MERGSQHVTLHQSVVVKKELTQRKEGVRSSRRGFAAPPHRAEPNQVAQFNSIHLYSCSTFTIAAGEGRLMDASMVRRSGHMSLEGGFREDP